MEGVLSRLGPLARRNGGDNREADRGEAGGWEVVGTWSEARHVHSLWDAIDVTRAAHDQVLAVDVTRMP